MLWAPLGTGQSRRQTVPWRKTFFSERVLRETPLHEFPDEVGPILAVDSITIAQGGRGAGGPPFSQLTIEPYTPLTGGLAIGGRFAPEGRIVPKRKVIVDDEE